MAKKYRTEAERAAEVVAWRQSGMTAAQWSGERGVSSGTLYRWADEQRGGKSPKNKRRTSATKLSRAITFAQLGDGFDSAATSTRSIVVDLMLTTGPARVRIDAGADIGTVQALMASLAAVSR
jgi:transposase